VDAVEHEHRVERIAAFINRVWTLQSGRLSEAETREALAEGGARPPVVDLALRAGWPSLPITVGEARPYADSLRPHLSQAPPSERNPGPIVRALRGITFSYPQAAVPVLQGLGLDLHAGEVAVLMGRNGSGKTTLLRLIAGLLRPTRGRVSGDVKARYVPQDADLLLFRPTVREELPSDGPWQERFAGRLDRYPRDLSTGERQQVAIAAAAGGSAVLLLDEPTRGLDPDTKCWLGDFLRNCAGEGISIVVATHDVEWAARFAQRVLLLGDGELYADGTPREVLTDSLVFSTQVNKFLGKGWLLPEEVPLQATNS
jgi:energy-coupling factor transport system ATP-binding protein